MVAPSCSDRERHMPGARRTFGHDKRHVMSFPLPKPK